MTGGRHKARSVILQALYEIDTAKHEPEIALGHLLAEYQLTDENSNFVRETVKGVFRYKDKLDIQIQRFAPAWPVAQIAVIDRNILRLAIYELLIDNKVPVKVAINEAVELAKAFGSDNSPRFVNGVLGAVSSNLKNENT
ncbi:MAG TPA: transcription antitermination factor NusB [Dehalococcoidales bacterium]|nr:transcription antitermination factor NusB [Dehalococcoidales bacterium]